MSGDPVCPVCGSLSHAFCGAMAAADRAFWRSVTPVPDPELAALRQRVAELERLLQIDRLVFPLNYADGSLPVMLHRKDGTSIAVRDLDARLAAAEADAAKLKRRMAALIPLFQEARDAITAIPLAAAKLRGLRLDLADRMDEVGELARWEAIDAMRSGNGGSEGL